jgi:amino acid transporter
MGRFLGILQTTIVATITVTGPELVSMTAGEAENPRKVLPKAFRAVFYRLGLFFVLGSLCIGIVVPSDSPELAAAYANGGSNAGSSPYVISMVKFGIPVLPHIVNAMLLTSCFSAGNGYLFCATRSLHGMALEGKAPKIFSRTTKSGVPVFSLAAVTAISALAFLNVSNGSGVVFSWLVNLVSCHVVLCDRIHLTVCLRLLRAC